MTDHIVSFTSPPVVEVVAGVSFAGISAEASALLAAFWKENLRHDYPTLQQQPPYSPPVEQLHSDVAPSSFSLDFSAAFPIARLWALSQDGNELLQLQPGWFACNWRKVKPDDEYDRWPRRRDAFAKTFDHLSRFLLEEGVAEPKIQQCEVSYINHIAASDTWHEHADIGKIFKGISQLKTVSPLEQVTVQAQFVLHHESGPYGRLHVKIAPAFGPNGRSLYVFELTARGAPFGEGTAGALAFLDRGREAIDRTFVDLTTEEMHREWGMQS